MRGHTFRHWVLIIGSGGMLWGGGSCVTGEQIQGAFADSLISVLGAFFTAVLEQALSGIVQL